MCCMGTGMDYTTPDDEQNTMSREEAEEYLLIRQIKLVDLQIALVERQLKDVAPINPACHPAQETQAKSVAEEFDDAASDSLKTRLSL